MDPGAGRGRGVPCSVTAFHRVVPRDRLPFFRQAASFASSPGMFGDPFGMSQG